MRLSVHGAGRGARVQCASWLNPYELPTGRRPAGDKAASLPATAIAPVTNPFRSHGARPAGSAFSHSRIGSLPAPVRKKISGIRWGGGSAVICTLHSTCTTKSAGLTRVLRRFHRRIGNRHVILDRFPDN